MRSLFYFAIEIWPDREIRHAFSCAVDAEEGARILAKLAPGVIAFQQWGDPEVDVWDDPDPLVIAGEVPSRLQQIDPDGRDPWLDDAA
ncbi:hypothetical protein [Brevundimonas sp. GCM10030266]|uniref:hypothetical protein n=1 Tax=Brevundimonas sp. GCM10030266 TaxID=3273386 RepID=UPI00360DB9B2